MELRRFGPTRRKVPVIGQGTWYSEDDDPATAVAALRRGLDLGMTHIDTAEMYGSVAEEIVGRGDRRAGATRSSWSRRSSPSTPRGPARWRPAKRSLARLGTDRLDCYLLHWRGEYPLEDTVAAFEQLLREGKILSWGVSNFDVSDLEEALAIAGEGGLVCNQVLYHLRRARDRARRAPLVRETRRRRGRLQPVRARRLSRPGHRGRPRARARSPRAHHATPRQVALRFLVRRPSVFAIPKASTPEHVAENAEAGDIRLTEAEIEPDRPGLPARPPSPRAADAVAHRLALGPSRRDRREASTGGPCDMTEHDLHAVAFPKLDEAQMAALERCPLTTLKRYRDGEKLFEAGDRDFRFFVVKSGEVEIVDESGETPKTVAVLGPGEFTGDVTQLTGGPAIVSAVARGDCEVYEVSPDALRQLLNHHPDLGDLILQAFIARRQLLRESGNFTGLRVIGSRYSQDTFRDPRLPGQEPGAVHLAGPGGRPAGRATAQAVRGERGRHARGRLGPQAAAAQPLEPRSWRRPSASAGRWSRRCTTWSWSGPGRRGWPRRSTAPPRG